MQTYGQAEDPLHGVICRHQVALRRKLDIHTQFKGKLQHEDAVDVVCLRLDCLRGSDSMPCTQ